MVKNNDLPDSAAPPSGRSLSLFFSPTPFILKVPLDPAEAGPQHSWPGDWICLLYLLHWQADSSPLRHLGSPHMLLYDPAIAPWDRHQRELKTCPQKNVYVNACNSWKEETFQVSINWIMGKKMWHIYTMERYFQQRGMSSDSCYNINTMLSERSWSQQTIYCVMIQNRQIYHDRKQTKGCHG